MFPPLLRHHVLDDDLTRVGRQEFTDEARVPEFRGDAQIFAAAHKGVGLAAFGRGRDAFGVKVLLFTTGDGDESEKIGRGLVWSPHESI